MFGVILSRSSRFQTCPKFHIPFCSTCSVASGLVPPSFKSCRISSYCVDLKHNTSAKSRLVHTVPAKVGLGAIGLSPCQPPLPVAVTSKQMPRRFVQNVRESGMGQVDCGLVLNLVRMFCIIFSRRRVSIGSPVVLRGVFQCIDYNFTSVLL